jgi:endonuclease YncB( thermonuclease family)
MVNLMLAAEGMADVRSYPPDTRWQDLLQAAEDAAKDSDRGIWAN